MSRKMEEDGTYPNRAYAEQILEEAGRRNPGPWISHSRYVALAARNIAQACPRLNSEKAYVLGLLHDIGRRYGRTDMRHSLDGYRYCCECGFPEVGKICMTHSFPNHDIREAFGNMMFYPVRLKTRSVRSKTQLLLKNCCAVKLLHIAEIFYC